MSKNNNKEQDLKEFREALSQLSKEDFDGHTDFVSLSVREKLTWLSELNYFRFVVKKNKSLKTKK